MGKLGYSNIDELTMSDTEFQKFKKIIYEQVGINLLPHKKIMLQGRIRKRLKKLEINNFSEYYDSTNLNKILENILNN